MSKRARGRRKSFSFGLGGTVVGVGGGVRATVATLGCGWHWNGCWFGSWCGWQPPWGHHIDSILDARSDRPGCAGQAWTRTGWRAPTRSGSTRTPVIRLVSRAAVPCCFAWCMLISPTSRNSYVLVKSCETCPWLCVRRQRPSCLEPRLRCSYGAVILSSYYTGSHASPTWGLVGPAQLCAALCQRGEHASFHTPACCLGSRFA